MLKKKNNKCDAIYGGKRCENMTSSFVVSKGQMFSLCTKCAKLEKLQANKE